MTKIDTNWIKIFEKYAILSDIDRAGVFQISSLQINEFMESRLMTKFDHASNLPTIFQQHDLSILPITRGKYLIGKFETYRRNRKYHQKF